MCAKDGGLEHKDTKGLFCLCSDTKRVVLDGGGAKCGKRKKIADGEDRGHHSADVEERTPQC